MDWIDEITLISEVSEKDRVNKNGFATKPKESTRTVFCNKKSVGYSEYFKSQQTGKLVEAKYEVHKADYGGEDVVEVNGRRYFVLKTYDTGTDTIELTLTDLLLFLLSKQILNILLSYFVVRSIWRNAACVFTG